MSTFFRLVSGMQRPRQSSAGTRRQQTTDTTENTQTDRNNEQSSSQNEGNPGGRSSSQRSTFSKLSGRFKKVMRRKPLDRPATPPDEPLIKDPEEDPSSKGDQGGDQNRETSTGNEPSKSKGEQAQALPAGGLWSNWKGKQAIPKDASAGENLDPSTMSESELALAMKLSQDEARRADSVVQDIQYRVRRISEALDLRRSENESQQEPETATKKAISFADELSQVQDGPRKITRPKPLDLDDLASSSTQTQGEAKTSRSKDLSVVFEEKVTGLEGSTSDGSLNPKEPEAKSSQPAAAGPSKKATGTSTEESHEPSTTEEATNEALENYIATAGLRDVPKPLLP